MRKKQPVAGLSAREMEIVGMLWREGPVTLSAAHAALGLPIGYTTVQTRLNRLVQKGIVARTDDRPARYRAAQTPERVGQAQAKSFLQRVSTGGVAPLIAHLVKDRSLTLEELQELKTLIAAAEKRLLSKPEKGPSHE